MNRQEHIDRATHFAALNRQGGLLLANAWDIASARVFEREGFAALGSSSAAIAYAHGLADAELMGREAMLAQVAAIAAAVQLPVTADIESGYGAEPDQVGLSVQAAVAAGAVGVNLEDRRHGAAGSGLYPLAQQTERVAAARAAALHTGLPVWINARIDSFLLDEGDDAAQRLALTLARGRAYLAAGADMVFVPGLLDLAAVRSLAAALGGPLSLMTMPGAPSAAAMFEAGAARVSLGLCPMLSTLGLLRDLAREARSSGTWQLLGQHFYGFAEAEALFSQALPPQ